jgi:hypothetical protein
MFEREQDSMIQSIIQNFYELLSGVSEFTLTRQISSDTCVERHDNIIILFLICSNVWNGNLSDFEPWSKVTQTTYSKRQCKAKQAENLYRPSTYKLPATSWRWFCAQVIVSFPSWPSRKCFFGLPRHPLEVKQVGSEWDCYRHKQCFFPNKFGYFLGKKI